MELPEDENAEEKPISKKLKKGENDATYVSQQEQMERKMDKKPAV